MAFSLVSTAERPDLAPVSARWRWEAFFRAKGMALEVIEARARDAAESRGAMPRTFVLLENGVPLGTASLIACDLQERPELTPWLAGVVVAPEARGRGLAARLVAGVEGAAHRAGFQELWLYTHTAERVYARAGWRRIEEFIHEGKTCALMRRGLAQSS